MLTQRHLIDPDSIYTDGTISSFLYDTVTSKEYRRDKERDKKIKTQQIQIEELIKELRNDEKQLHQNEMTIARLEMLLENMQNK